MAAAASLAWRGSRPHSQTVARVTSTFVGGAASQARTRDERRQEDRSPTPSAAETPKGTRAYELLPVARPSSRLSDCLVPPRPRTRRPSSIHASRWYIASARSECFLPRSLLRTQLQRRTLDPTPSSGLRRGAQRALSKQTGSATAEIKQGHTRTSDGPPPPPLSHNRVRPAEPPSRAPAFVSRDDAADLASFLLPSPRRLSFSLSNGATLRSLLAHPGFAAFSEPGRAGRRPSVCFCPQRPSPFARPWLAASAAAFDSCICRVARARRPL